MFINTLNKKVYNITTIAIWIAVVVIHIACTKDDPSEDIVKSPTPYNWQSPTHFPESTYNFDSNPLTNEGVKLGTFLFYDGVLSRTNVIGCGTCHQPQSAFTHHGHELSHGVDDLIGRRNSIPLQNLAWSKSFFWDGGVHQLDLTALNALSDPNEMDENMSTIITKLNAPSRPSAKLQIDYPKMFKEAFGSTDINSERILKALSQFMTTLVSSNSKYDYYKMGDLSAMTATEKEGMRLFEQKCSSCHSGVLQTDHSFRNNGLTPTRGNDQGRYEITGNEEDKFKFKVPSLRNVGVTAPYMHDGRYHTLQEVLDHYNDSISRLANTSNEAAKTLDPIFTNTDRIGIPLTPAEQTSIIAFLNTLTDETFIRNPQFADPGIGNAL